MLNEPETALPPGQTFTPKQLRILKASVIIMGVLLVLGFGLLLIGIYLQASKIGVKAPISSAPASGTPAVATIPAVNAPNTTVTSTPVAIEPGAVVHEAFADQGKLI